MTPDAFAYDAFRIEQLIRPLVNLYQVTPLAPGGTAAGGPVAFVRQKRMAIREDIRFFRDESESEELFRIKARQVFDIPGARYDVTTPDGTRIGVLAHEFRKSLVRSTWRLLDASEAEVGKAQERSQALAILRRVVDFVPYGGWLPIPYNFAILSDGKEVGSFMRHFLSLRDRYDLDLSSDPDRRIDRRVAIALAVALDALQNR